MATVKLHVAVLPTASVAVQVTVDVPTGKVWPEVTTWLLWFLQATVTPGQLSVEVTVKLTGPLAVPGGQLDAAEVMFAGHVITGGCVSLTVTVNVHISGPAPLLDLHVTVVVPTGKKEPETGEQAIVPHAPPFVVGVKVTTAPHWLGSLL